MFLSQIPPLFNVKTPRSTGPIHFQRALEVNKKTKAAKILLLPGLCLLVLFGWALYYPGGQAP